jgi:hypothetical protein
VKYALLLIALAGCAPTDTGNPPLAPVVDPTLIDGLVVSGLVEVTVTVTGGPGSIDVDRGSIYVLDFDTTAPPHRATIAADGSFSLMFASDEGHDLRLWAELDGARSAPFDFYVATDGIHPREPELDGCIAFEPRFHLDAPGACVVTNGCATAVSIEASIRNAPSGAFSISPSTAAIDPGGSTPFSVTASTTAVDAAFFDVTGATLGRHVVTLHDTN